MPCNQIILKSARIQNTHMMNIALCATGCIIQHDHIQDPYRTVYISFVEGHCPDRVSGGRDMIICRCILLLPLTQTCFNPAHTSTPRGACNTFCHIMRRSLLRHNINSDHVLSGSHLWLTEPVATCRHCSSGGSNPRPFGSGSYAPTNCTITADLEQVQ
jgi:hypothetical protein